MRYQLTEPARAEILELYLYGIEKFGLVQADRYLSSLEERFGMLAEFPRMGRAAPRLGKDVRRHEYKSHVILYRLAEATVIILAVVHGRSLINLEL